MAQRRHIVGAGRPDLELSPPDVRRRTAVRAEAPVPGFPAAPRSPPGSETVRGHRRLGAEELIAVGAVAVEHRRDGTRQLTNRYFVRTTPQPGGRTDAAPPARGFRAHPQVF